MAGRKTNNSARTCRNLFTNQPGLATTTMAFPTIFSPTTAKPTSSGTPAPVSDPQRQQLALKTIRATMSEKDFEQVHSLLECYERAKRSFSNLCEAKSTSGTKVARTGDFLFTKNNNILKSKLELVMAELEAKHSILVAIKSSWWDGLHYFESVEAYDNACVQMYKDIGELLVVKDVLTFSRHEIAGGIADLQAFEVNKNAATSSYVELLLGKSLADSKMAMKADPDDRKQRIFRQTLFEKYALEHRNGREVWCPISAAWVEIKSITATHTVRRNLGEWSVQRVFGRDVEVPVEGHIWCPKNGLLIHQRLAELLDNGSIAIVPTEGYMSLMTIVLDDRLLKHEGSLSSVPYGKQLDKRILNFQPTCEGMTDTGFRPGMEYLYFAFAVNMLRRQRHEAPGWWKDQVRYQNVGAFDVPPGRWTRASTMRKLASRIGHLSARECLEWFGGRADTMKEREAFHDAINTVPTTDLGTKGRGRGKEQELRDEDEDTERNCIAADRVAAVYWD